MKKLFAVLLVIISIVSLFSVSVSAAGNVYTIDIDVCFNQTQARSMLSMINNLRKPQNAWYWNETNSEKLIFPNLKPLVYDYELEKIAMQRAAEIAVSYDHTRPDGTTCFTAFNNDYMWRGENIAMGQPTAEDVFESWAETDDAYSGQGHRRNMLNSNFTSVGIGHVIVNGVHFWVQEFGSPTLSQTHTEPCDTTKSVKMDISSSLPFSIYSFTSINEKGITVDKSTDIPSTHITFQNKFTVTDFQMRNADYLIADSSVAVIKNNTIYGIATGQTTLTVSFADKKLEIPINVISAASESEILTVEPGDIDTNGKISASDARLVLRASAKLESFNAEQTKAADVNGDNKITASDARKILRVSAKLDTF